MGMADRRRLPRTGIWWRSTIRHPAPGAEHPVVEPPHRKPIPADAVCDEIVEAAIHEEIEDAIKENQERNVIITYHFPLLTLGKYGGWFR